MELIQPVPPGVCRAILIRHGETLWNKERRIQGTVDIDLSDVGREQCKKKVEIMKKEHSPSQLDLIGKVYSSTLSRAAESARLIHSGLGLKCPIATDAGLMEWNAGCIQGKLVTEVMSILTNNDPDYNFENGESRNQRAKRICSALRRIAKDHDGQCILIVSHGGVMSDVVRACRTFPPSAKGVVSNLQGVGIDINLDNNEFTFVGFDTPVSKPAEFTV